MLEKRVFRIWIQPLKLLWLRLELVVPDVLDVPDCAVPTQPALPSPETLKVNTWMHSFSLYW